MATDLSGLTRLQLDLGHALVAARGRQRDRHQDRAEVHDHAPVGSPDQSAPARTAHPEPELAERGSGGEPGQREREQRRPAACPQQRRDHQRGNSRPRRPEEPLAQHAGVGTSPRHHRGDGHQGEQREPDRNRHPVEVRNADRQPLAVDRLHEKREHRAQQHHEGEPREDEVVEQDGPLARHRRLDPADGTQQVRPPGDQPERDGHDDHEEAQQHRADRAGGEGVDRLHHPGAGEEGTEDGQAEGGAQQRDVPHAQHPVALLHHHGVKVCGAGDPRQQGRVLHRVPGPVSAPAEHLVAPPPTEHYARGEEAPGHEGPAPGLHQPTLTEATRDQRADSEGEGHHEADVAEVEHRRVEGHQDVVLQQRVRTRSVVSRRRVEGLERVGCEQQYHQERRGHREHREQRPSHQRIVETLAEPLGDRHQVAGQDQGPQQDRALQRRPEGGDVEQRRGGRRTVLGHIGDGEVPGDQGPLHGQEAHRGTDPHHEGIAPGAA